MRYLSPGMPTSRVRGTGPGWCIGFRLGFSFEEEWGSSSMGIRFQGLHCFDRREHVIAIPMNSAGIRPKPETLLKPDHGT